MDDRAADQPPSALRSVRLKKTSSAPGYRAFDTAATPPEEAEMALWRDNHTSTGLKSAFVVGATTLTTTTHERLTEWARAYGECLLFPEPVVGVKLIYFVARTSDGTQTWIARLDSWTSVVLVSMTLDGTGALMSISTAAAVDD
jgi:hypothetical protein